jgi:hypothetical protein
VRFDNRGWYFVSADGLRETQTSVALDETTAHAIGMTFEEMLGKLQ